MELKFAMLADAVNISHEGKLNITGEFDSISADRVPATHASLHLVARFEARVSEGTQHQVQLGFFDEDGQPLLPMSPHIPMPFSVGGPGRPLRGQVVAHFENLQLPRFGGYEFHILINGRHEASVPLYLHPRASG